TDRERRRVIVGDRTGGRVAHVNTARPGVGGGRVDGQAGGERLAQLDDVVVLYRDGHGLGSGRTGREAHRLRGVSEVLRFGRNVGEADVDIDRDVQRIVERDGEGGRSPCSTLCQSTDRERRRVIVRDRTGGRVAHVHGS